MQELSNISSSSCSISVPAPSQASDLTPHPTNTDNLSLNPSPAVTEKSNSLPFTFHIDQLILEEKKFIDLMNSFLQTEPQAITTVATSTSTCFTVLDRMLVFHMSMLSKLDTCRTNPEFCLPELFVQSAKELEENLSEIYSLQKEQKNDDKTSSDLFEKITSEVITRIQNYLLVLTEMRDVYTTHYDELTNAIDALAMLDFESKDLCASPAESLESIYTSLPQPVAASEHTDFIV